MKVFESAASCVEQFSQLKQYFAKLTVLIKDQWVENNISKIQLDPTVNEVTMDVLPKGVWVVKIWRKRAQMKAYPRVHSQMRPKTLAAARKGCLGAYKYPLNSQLKGHPISHPVYTLYLCSRTSKVTLQLGRKETWSVGGRCRSPKEAVDNPSGRLRFSVYLRFHLSSPPFVFYAIM